MTCDLGLREIELPSDHGGDLNAETIPNLNPIGQTFDPNICRDMESRRDLLIH